jgi:hypothetical protein
MHGKSNISAAVGPTHSGQSDVRRSEQDHTKTAIGRIGGRNFNRITEPKGEPL